MKIKLIESNTDSLEKAKELINDYCEREFGDNADFSDLSNIGLAYTTSEDESHEYQVTVNLIDYTMNYYVDGNLVYRDKYPSLDNLITRDLMYLDFDSLINDCEYYYSDGIPLF